LGPNSSVIVNTDIMGAADVGSAIVPVGKA
jgi:hypothetical protein